MKIFLLLIISCPLLTSILAPTHFGANTGQKASVPVLKTGDTCAGGIIFWLAPRTKGNEQHGLICAAAEQSLAIRWCPENCKQVHGTETGLSMDSTGRPTKCRENTNVIIAAYGAGNYAAALCKSLTLNGYSDWFLPSKDDLNIMYRNLERAKIGGFAPDYYWSSSEGRSNVAWGQDFAAGPQYDADKTGAYRVRAIRQF